MSHSTYNKQWHEAQQHLNDLLVQEIPPEEQKPEKDRVAAFQLIATMYIKYIQIFRKLEQCYDQIVHPQKRRVLRHVLDGVSGRVLELKNEMVNLEFSEYHYFDDVLSDLKLTPNDVEMPIPKHFINERAKALKEREHMLGAILAKMGPSDKEEKDEVKMSLEDAIRLIQTHERARQGRVRALMMKEIINQEKRLKQRETESKTSKDDGEAAVIIQKWWRGILCRTRTQKMREEELMWLGMTPPPSTSQPKNTAQSQAVRVEQARRVTQAMYEQEFQQALVTVKEKIRETEGPDMKETMQDQIRQWFLECRDATGKFPEYPDEDDGGSATVFKEKSPEELEKELKEKDEGGGKKEKGKGKKSGKKDKKGKKGKDDKKGKGKGKGKGKDDDDEDEGWKMAESKFATSIREGTHTYETVWKYREEGDNFSQKHDVELIKEEKRLEVESDIRCQVDELMRQELKNLKMAVDREKGKKGKGKKSGKKKKGKKGKKSGKKKGKKGKKEKDLTPDRTIESLYEELVMEGIIKKVPKVFLHDYEGEYSYLGTTLRQANIEPQPSLSDVRRLVTEFAILPLGSQDVHEKSPLIKSMLLAGPSGVGKKMLIHTICNETGANLFDLTATNIAGKYPGKDGLKMLLHLVFKVGRALQPSVFMIDDCDKMFKKKIPKTDLSDPKRLKKEFPKLMKGIKAEDRIMLIGCSRTPFEAELKPFCGLYQKIILIPRPDYASRHLIWRKLITKNHGIIHSGLDISSLTKISDGYTMGHIMQACEQVLTDRRVSQLSKKPLQASEFIAPLSRIDPVYTEEEEAFKDWYKKTPLGKKRAKAQQGDDDDGGKGKGKGKKGGKKSGKKGKKK